MTAALAVLNPAALVALASCEQRIERGLKTFIDVGQALAEIRDSRLYKGSHSTFEEYLEQRWQMSRSYAHRMIAAAEVVLPIGNTDLPSPTNEGQARALGKVPEAERADVWRETVERTDGKPTAAAIREVHEERTRSPFPGPSDAAIEPPVDPGATPPAAPVPPDPQDPDLTADVVRVLAGAGELGMTVPEIWCKTPGGTASVAVKAAVDALCEAGRVLVASTSKHGTRWMLTPEPGAVSTAPSGSGQHADLDSALEAEMEGTASRFRRNFSTAVARADDVWGFDVDRIAEVYAGDFDKEVQPFLDEMTRWCERVSAAHRRAPGLRLLNGGAR